MSVSRPPRPYQRDAAERGREPPGYRDVGEPSPPERLWRPRTFSAVAAKPSKNCTTTNAAGSSAFGGLPTRDVKLAALAKHAKDLAGCLPSLPRGEMMIDKARNDPVEGRIGVWQHGRSHLVETDGRGLALDLRARDPQCVRIDVDATTSAPATLCLMRSVRIAVAQPRSSTIRARYWPERSAPA